MPEQSAIATNQRRNLTLEAIQRLSKTRSWVTQRDLLVDLRGQGYDVQKHHVLRDLKALAQIHAELECHNDSNAEGLPRRGVEFGYRWVARRAAPETGLSIPEALSLVLVSRYLKQALPATLGSALDRLFKRAADTLDLQQKNGAAHWKDLVGVVVPTQPMQPPRINLEVVQVVHQALIAKEQFWGQYRNIKGGQDERLLNPLGIMVREPSIYLIAVADGYEEPRMFAMHRFISARREHSPVNEPAGFDLHTYLDEQGNFGSGKWLTLKAIVCPNLAQILEETPLGSNQALGGADENGWTRLTVRVRDNWQLRWWLMAQADRIIVYSPKDIRNRLLDNAKRLIEQYKII